MHAPKARIGLAGLSFAIGLVAQAGPPAAKAQESFTIGGVEVRRHWEGGAAHPAASRDGGRTWQPLADPDDVLYFRRAQYDPVRGDVQLPGLLGAPKSNRLFLVQFQTQILAEYQQALRDRGVEILHYLPEDALFVRADRDRALALRELGCVRWVGDLQNGFKLDDDLAKFALADGAAARECNLVLAKKSDRLVLIGQIAALGGHVSERCEGSVLIQARLTPAQLRAVLELDTVTWADPTPTVGIDMDHARIQGGANYIESVAGYNGTGVRAEITEGLDQTHPDWTNPVVERNDSVQDHGHCTSMIVGGNGSGNPLARGMLPNGTIIENSYIDMANASNLHYGFMVGSTDPTLPWHTMVATASWGGTLTTLYTSVSQLVDNGLFDSDLTRTQSQSNAGTQNSRPEAWAKNIISVGGVVHHDNADPADDNWGPLSPGGLAASIGPASDGGLKPDICAYYDLVLCGDRPGSAGYNTAAGVAGNYFTGFNGTSAATPIVAGHVGLIQQMFTDGLFGNPLPLPATAANRFQNKPHMSTSKALLCNTAAQYTFSGTTANLTRVHQGWGFPNLQRVYDNRNKLLVVDEYEVLQQGQTRSYLVWIAPNTAEFRATMVYADPEAQANASIHRVNNLDLKVVRLADGTFWWGNNGLSANMFSTSGGIANDRDTIECVYLSNPTSGLYRVSVTAASIVQDGHVETPALDADFALVMHPLGGGFHNRDTMALALASATPGDLSATLTNVPAAGWSDGFTFFSFNTFHAPGFGSFFGLEDDFITAAIFTLPAVAGDVFHFTNAGAGSYPFAPFTFPPSLVLGLSGLQVDGMVTLFDATGQIAAQSNVDRVLIR